MTGKFEPFKSVGGSVAPLDPPSSKPDAPADTAFSVPFATPLRAVSGLWVLCEGTLRVANDATKCHECGCHKGVTVTDFRTGKPGFFALVIGQWDRALDRIRRAAKVAPRA